MTSGDTRQRIARAIGSVFMFDDSIVPESVIVDDLAAATLRAADAVLAVLDSGEPERECSIREWQALSAEWTDSRFPGDNLPQRGLVLGEETGEVLRCILKAEQNIRGGTDKWLADLPAETADVFFCLTAIAHRAGFDLAAAIDARWAAIRERQYPTGALSPEPEENR